MVYLGSSPCIFLTRWIAAVSLSSSSLSCALASATSMSIGVGIGKGAGAGVLIKSAEALEHMEKVNTLVVDKTGTLTEVRVYHAPGLACQDNFTMTAAWK